jgi:DNA primase
MNTTEELTKLIDICHDNLKKTTIGKEYFFTDRNISTDSFKKYKLGYFPKNLSKLTSYVSEDFLKEIGVIDFNGTSSFSTYYPIIFPVLNEYGQPIGIAGRSLLSDSERNIIGIPKYKNSKYKKTNFLFGLNLAKKSILLNQNVIVVEGYFDQISLFDAGIENTVAVCGTAFSKNHFVKLARYTDKISFLLDGDQPGQKSAENIYNKYINRGIKLRFISLPKSYKDAGEFFLDSDKTANDFYLESEEILPMEW